LQTVARCLLFIYCKDRAACNSISYGFMAAGLAVRIFAWGFILTLVFTFVSLGYQSNGIGTMVGRILLLLSPPSANLDALDATRSESIRSCRVRLSMYPVRHKPDSFTLSGIVPLFELPLCASVLLASSKKHGTFVPSRSRPCPLIWRPGTRRWALVARIKDDILLTL
jgi:hypothetical protein